MTLSCQPPAVATLIEQLQHRGLPYEQALIEAWKEHLSARAAHYDDLSNDEQQKARFVMAVACSNLAEPVEDLHKVARLLGVEIADEVDRLTTLEFIAIGFLGWYA